MALAFTQAQLDALNAALVNGRLTIEYDGRRVTYRSLAEMLMLRSMILIELGLATQGPVFRVAEHSKGTT